MICGFLIQKQRRKLSDQSTSQARKITISLTLLFRWRFKGYHIGKRRPTWNYADSPFKTWNYAYSPFKTWNFAYSSFKTSHKICPSPEHVINMSEILSSFVIFTASVIPSFIHSHDSHTFDILQLDFHSFPQHL